MGKVHLTSFCTPDYTLYLKDMVQSAKKYGIKNCYCYSLADLMKTDFYQRHEETFKQKTGFGYWLWKPFFVNEALSRINFGDVLFYVDAASLFINNPQPLIDIAKLNTAGIVAFDACPLVNSQWTKRDCFINMNCDNEKYWNAKHVIATLFLIRKTDFTVSFFSEWLNACENISSLSDNPNLLGKDDLPGFVSHRMDQSIFSILMEKYTIETYRNPSKWGNFQKTDAFRVKGEHVSSPYGLPPHILDYTDKPYLNSPYGTIMEFNRRVYHSARQGLKQKLYAYFKM